MATRPASKLNLQEFGLQDEVEIVDKQARQSIENMIDDTTTASTSTWSSEKITDEIEDKTSVTKTTTGNPIELTDAASAPIVKCVTEIQGSQDLHGYDKPWVGGAGKNKLPLVLADIKTLNIGGTWSGDAYTISGVTFTILTDSNGNVTGVSVNGTATGNITFLLTDTNGSWMTDGTTYKINGSVGGSYNTWSIWVQGHGTNPSEMSLDGDGTFTYSTGGSTSVRISVDSGVSLSNQMFRPMIRLSTESDSTFEPYSNICPITAYTEGEIEVRGKNILDPSQLSQIEGGTVGAYVGVGFLFRAGKTYTLSNSFNLASISIYSVDLQTQLAYQSNNNKVTYTPTVDTLGIPRFYKSGLVVADLTTVQLEVGSLPTTYEPYTSTTHTTTYPSAIYRGSEDVVNGKVQSDYSLVDLGSLAWTLISAQGASVGRLQSEIIVDAKLPSTTAIKANMVCDCFEVSNTDSVYITPHQIGLNTDGRLWVSATDIYEGAAAFKTAMSGHMLAYEKSTPVESEVTPTNLPIKSLLGYNHIESSTGEMEVEYITEEYQPLVDLIEDNAVSDMTGATSSTDGTHGLVPAPSAGDEDKFLKGDGTWGEAGGNIVYSSTPKIVGKWIDGVTDVYEVTMVTNHINPTGTDYSYFPDTFSKIISVTGSISGQVAGSSRYYAPMGGWFKQSNDNINIDCSVYLGNFGPDNVRVYYAFHDQSTITPGGMSCDEQTIVVRYLR